MKLFLKLVVALAVLGTIGYALMYKSPQQKAFETALAAAQKGDARAQTQAGAMYLAGEGVKPDVKQGADWYKKAAAQGEAKAAYELAQLYLSGEQLPRDVPTGVSYLKLAAANNYPAAQYALGRLYQTGADGLPASAGQSAFLWMKAAAQGDADAQAAMDALKTENPELFAQVRQLHQFEGQAMAADAQAALHMALAYQDGVLLEKNPEEAARWFAAAAQGGQPQAQYELALLYGQEDGPLPKDEALAAQWLQKAAEGGWAGAQYAQGNRIYQNAQTAEDFKTALQWFGKAGRQNEPEALYMSGIMYMQGQGGEKSVPLAIAAFKQAAELGHANAQYVVGQSYWRGIGLKQSKANALKWLELARQNGNEQAAALMEQIK